MPKWLNCAGNILGGIRKLFRPRRSPGPIFFVALISMANT
jgi:hypothetical protein